MFGAVNITRASGTGPGHDCDAVMLVAPTRTIMLVAPSTPILRKGGIPRKPAGEVKVRTIDNRRCIDKKRRKEFLASGKALPPELLNIEEASGIIGRPRLSDEAIELKKHASAQRMRRSRAKRAAADVATGAEAARSCYGAAKLNKKRIKYNFATPTGQRATVRPALRLLSSQQI